MSTVERAQAIFGDPSLVALREWEGLNGEMGVYHSQAHDYYYLHSHPFPGRTLYPAVSRDGSRPGHPCCRMYCRLRWRAGAPPLTTPSAFAFRPIYGSSRLAMPSSALLMHSCPRKDGLKGFFWPRQHYHDEVTQHQIQEALCSAIARLKV